MTVIIASVAVMFGIFALLSFVSLVVMIMEQSDRAYIRRISTVFAATSAVTIALACVAAFK